MALFSISDLHLSLRVNKPMDEFGDIWKNHDVKIKNNWEKTVEDDDTVLIAGDVSWAMHENEATPDLDFIDKLPGKKIITTGNHDYWWNSTSALNRKFETMTFVKNSFASYEDYAVCGSKGWICPNDSLFTAHDKKLYNRELIRFKNSMDQAKKQGYSQIIAMLHFPPTNEKKESSGFTDLIYEYPVKHVVYGHLHGYYSFKNSFDGIRENVHFHLTSSDYLNFMPKKIL